MIGLCLIDFDLIKASLIAPNGILTIVVGITHDMPVCHKLPNYFWSLILISNCVSVSNCFIKKSSLSTAPSLYVSSELFKLPFTTKYKTFFLCSPLLKTVSPTSYLPTLISEIIESTMSWSI